MKAPTSLICALAATLLLAIGLARLADRLDPIMETATEVSPEILTAGICLPSNAPTSFSNLG